MAPTKPTEPSIQSTQEYDDFLDTLAAYHEKRGWVKAHGSLAMSAY